MGVARLMNVGVVNTSFIFAEEAGVDGGFLLCVRLCVQIRSELVGLVRLVGDRLTFHSVSLGAGYL